MGARGEAAAALTDSTRKRGWPLVIRRATEADHGAVLAFASGTWDGWDYIPNAWPVWLAATDGAFLVGTVGESPGARHEPLLDAEGSPLDVGQVVAITRVAMVSDSEAWLEGIRVDPRVRGMGVAADLQVAELQWVAAQDASVLRYATGASNEASHRLGARDDIKLLVRFRAWWWSATGSVEDDDHEPSAFDEAVREEATERRRAALGRLSAAGLVVSIDEFAVDDPWRRLSGDATFAAGEQLYEPRSWAMQELTEAQFHRHIERGEVVVNTGAVQGDGWAIAILVSEQLPSEDSSVRLALLCGEGRAAAALAGEIHRLTDEPVRFRVPVGAPMITGHERRFRHAGFVTPDWELHILARQMDDGAPLPPVDPSHLILADAPARIEPPRW